MAYETLVAVYDTAAHADAAVRALKAAGFHESDISVFDGERLKAGKAALSANVKEPGLWNRLFGTDVYQHEANIYGQTVQDGGVVLSLRVPESEIRLFGKPESYVKRRMGVALARSATTDEARARAKEAASLVKPVRA